MVRTVESSDNYMEWHDEDGNHFVTFADTPEEICRAAVKLYAFDDCYPIEVTTIVADRHDLRYVGWMPGMRYVFKDICTGEVVFDECFEEYDH